MKNKSIIYIGIGLISAAVLFILFYTYTPEDKTKESKPKKAEKKPNDWYQKFGHQNLHPYGTFIFYQLLKDQNKNKVRTLKRNSQYKNLDTIKTKKRLYVFIGKKFDSHYKRIEKILAFVNRGNDAFISADILPPRVKNIIADYYKVHRSYYKNIETNFKDSSLRSERNFNFKFIFKRKNIYRYWTDLEKASNYYDVDDVDDSETEVFEQNSLTYNPVFISVPYGKGKLYLHTTPYSFTNIVMRYERGVEHAERVIACLPKEPLIFDSFLNSSANGNDGGSPDGQPHLRSSPLEFILENQSLRWAYYVMLIGLFIYILTKGKRKQKTIPPKEEIENNSVEFADTMSKLYLQYGQHKYIVFQQEKNLLNYIRNKYYIKSIQIDEDYINRVAIKSGISNSRISDIFNRFKKIKTQNHATSNDVVEIYAEIEYFYKNCK